MGFADVMTLIEKDCTKFRAKKYPRCVPTNLFAISTLLRLIGTGYPPAKDFFLKLVSRPDFAQLDLQYDSFELLASQGIPEKDPDFIDAIFQHCDFRPTAEHALSQGNR